MRSSYLPALAGLCLLASPVVAQAPAPAPAAPPAAASPMGTCKAQAGEKNLRGAALASFMRKCQSDATKACDMQASERKLAGAAKTSFSKKCVTDAVGT